MQSQASGVQATAANAAPPGDALTIQVIDDGSEQAIGVTVTRDLGTLIARAASINNKRETFDLSFSSLMLATLYGPDALGRWLADYFRRQNLKTAHLLTKVKKTAAEAQSAAAEGARQRATRLSTPLRRTASARRAMDEAAAMASAQGVALDAPHLVFSLIGINNYHVEDFRALGLNRARCAAAFLQHMAQRTPAPEMEHWKRHYQQRFEGSKLPPLDAVARPGHRPDYDADAYTSHDLLSIDDEVEALAYVIAARRTTPPLAVGLFGEWGSGKTFFMKHLRRQIDLLAEGALKQKPAERAVHGRIAQIEFNAWHYQEGDLWASLVDHILRNLRFGEDEDEAKVRERRQLAMRELDVVKARGEAAAQRAGEANEQVKGAERLVSEKQGEERSRREALAQALVSKPALQAIRKGTTLDPETARQGQALLKQLNIDVVQNSAEELRDGLSGARQELASVLAFLVPLFRAEDRGRRALLLAAAFGLPALVAAVVVALTTQQDLDRAPRRPGRDRGIGDGRRRPVAERPDGVGQGRALAGVHRRPQGEPGVRGRGRTGAGRSEEGGGRRDERPRRGGAGTHPGAGRA